MERKEFQGIGSKHCRGLDFQKSEHQEDILNRFNLADHLLREQGNLDKDNFLVPSLMKQVYIDASTPN